MNASPLWDELRSITRDFEDAASRRKCKRRFETIRTELSQLQSQIADDTLIVGDAPTMPPLAYHLDCLSHIDWECPAPMDLKVLYHLRMALYLTHRDGESSPLVSIVIPVRDGADCITRAVESCFSQDYPRLEVLVVDDGSTDETNVVASSLHGPVRVIRQMPQGVSAARNRGVDEAKGDLVHFLDADDELLPGAITDKVRALALRPEARACYTHFEVEGDLSAAVGAGFEQFPLEDGRSATGDPMLAVCSRFPFQASTLLVPRWFLEHSGRFETDLRQSEDARYWFHMARAGLRAIALPASKTRRHRRAGSLTHHVAQSRKWAIEADLRSAAELANAPRQYRYIVCLLTRATWLLDRAYDDGLDQTEIECLHQRFLDFESQIGRDLPGSEGLTALLIDQLIFMLGKKRESTPDLLRPMLRLWDEREDNLRQRLAEAPAVTGTDLRRWLPDLPPRRFALLARSEKASLKFALEQLQISVMLGELPLRFSALERVGADYPGHPYERYWRQAFRLARLLGDQTARILVRQWFFREGWKVAGRVRRAFRNRSAA